MDFHIPTLTLEKDEKIRLQKLMAASLPILSKAATRNFGNDNVCTLRDAYRSKAPLDITVEEMSALDDLLDNEPTILAGWVRVGLDLCLAFSLAFGKTLRLDLDDLISEAYVKIYNAIYQYDGRTEFSTYVYYVVKRQLIGCTRKARRQLAKEILVPVEDLKNMFAPQIENGKEEDEKQEMIEAMAMTPLTERQRTILETYIECDFCQALAAEKLNKISRQALAAEKLNKISRQAVNQIIISVREKMKDTLESIHRSTAA
jgi:RNA polymerase sigma factor (sigma-70 family)